MCFTRRIVTEPIPVARAFSMDRSEANSATTWPNAQLPSICAVEADSDTIRGAAEGISSPRSMASTYSLRRRTPWEWCPMVSLSTRWSATSRASAGEAPAASSAVAHRSSS